MAVLLSRTSSLFGRSGEAGRHEFNLGMYRVQLTGNEYETNKEVGIHYQIHRGIGIHQAKANNWGDRLK